MEGDQARRLGEMIEQAQNIVFFGGAGVSTESGIPDFRSPGGHFEAIRRFGASPETLLSRAYFEKEPETFFAYYKAALLVTDAKPNRAHLALAALERRGKLRALITQNIDGLHQKAGSRTVYELHGSIARNHCMRCRAFYDAAFVKASPGVPRCSCGGIVKPDVVLYGEMLDDATVEQAVNSIAAADLLIVGGTSLAVYPAAGFLEYYGGKKLVLINKSQTPCDNRAALVIRAPIGEALGEAVPAEEKARS